MMTIRRDIFEQDSFVVRALSTITNQQADAISQAVHSISQEWAVHTTHDYNDYLSVLIEPHPGKDDQTSFFISGTAKQLALSETRGDDLLARGTFNDVEPLTKELLGRLAQP